MYVLFEKIFHFTGGEGSPPHAAFFYFLSVSICIKFQPQSNQEFNYFSDVLFVGESIKQRADIGGISSDATSNGVKG